MSLIDEWMKSDTENTRLHKLEEELKPAHMRGLKKCIRCGYCCHRRTCIPTPEEVKKIAEFLKLTPKETINKYFVIDRKWLGDAYFVKPAGINTECYTGKFLPAEDTFNEGVCVFLDIKNSNKCKIYPVLPLNAKLMKCWEWNDDSKTKKVVEENKKIMDTWNDNALKKEFGIDGEALEDEEGDE